MGSGLLDWPVNLSERVAIQIELCRAISNKQIDALQFLYSYCNENINDVNVFITRFTEIIIDPMIRDMRRLSERCMLPPILFESMSNIPESGDSILDSMLKESFQRFRDPAPSSRKLAVERLWDTWERLKSLEAEGNKQLSTKTLSRRAAKDTSFSSLLLDEAQVLTKIGNNYHIRHFEENRETIPSIKLYDYLFQRMYALIHLFLSSRGRDNDS